MGRVSTEPAESRTKLINPLEFVLGGKAIFTIKNTCTGNRFTFKATQAKKIKTVYWISVLTMRENFADESYRFIGCFSVNRGFTYSDKSVISQSAMSVRAADYYFRKLLNRSLPSNIVTYHQGRCARCGRLLTVPESIESGFGPECDKLRKSH